MKILNKTTIRAWELLLSNNTKEVRTIMRTKRIHGIN